MVHISQVSHPFQSSHSRFSFNTATASKPINRVLHLQQIVNLPGINDGDINATSSSNATVPAKKPVRKQPKGLRMRFRPIGFGSGKLGRLGSDSSDSGSDEEMEDAPAVFRRPVLEDEDAFSNSDEAMEDAPPVAIKPKKSKTDGQAKSSPLKRKHVDDKPATKSSSQPIAVLNNTPLKKLKKKQKEPHQSMAGSPSASTEPVNSASNPHSKKAKHASPTTPDLVSSPTRPSSSQLIPQKYSKKHSRETEKTPGERDDLSLHDLTKATDPNLTGEERRKKIKKLKHKDRK